MNYFFDFLILYFTFLYYHRTLAIDYLIKEENLENQLYLKQENEWNINLEKFSIKQISGIAFDSLKSVVSIFHRANVVWDENSFYENNTFKNQKNPIQFDVVLDFNLNNLQFIRGWGKNMFYMPHGISYDYEGDIWLTDVALNQVFLFEKNNLTVPKLTFGKKFESGSDRYHFCQPTDVQVSQNGLVFISDGYCNSRILIFHKKNNTFIKEIIIEGYILPIIHSLTIIEENDLVCTALRQIGIVQCFNLKNLDNLILEYSLPSGSLIYAIDHLGKNLILTGMLNKYQSFVKLYNSNNKSHTIYPPIKLPHDLTCDNANNIYLSELSLNSEKKVFKISIVKNFLSLSKESNKLEKRINYHSNAEQLNEQNSIETSTNLIKNINENDLNNSINNDEKNFRLIVMYFFILITFILTFYLIVIVSRKRYEIENYLRNFFRKKFNFKTSFIDDPESVGFNRLCEDDNVYDYDLESSSDSEVEEFNLNTIRKI